MEEQQTISMEEIEKKLFEGHIVRDNKVYFGGELVEVLGIIPNKAEMKKLEKLRKLGLFVYLADSKVVVYVKVYHSKDVEAIINSVSLRVLEKDKIEMVRNMFPDKKIIFYPQLSGKISNRARFVDALIKIQYSAGLRDITVLEHEFEESIADFEKQLQKIQIQYPNALLLPTIDLKAEVLLDSELPIYDKIKVCNSFKNIKTAMVICRGYGGVKEQMRELALASLDFEVKLVMAGTLRTISINKKEISGVDLAKYFGCNGAFIKYPDYVDEDFVPKIKRLNVKDGFYKTLNETEKKQLATEKKIQSGQLYDFTRIEDIETLRSVWADITKENAKKIMQERKIEVLL